MQLSSVSMQKLFKQLKKPVLFDFESYLANNYVIFIHGDNNG